MRKLSILFIVLALLLSHTMCAVIAYNYSYLSTCVFYTLCSFPAYSSFIYVIPYGIGIIICIILAITFNKKHS